jgi:SAM-dependent methyltransferase
VTASPDDLLAYYGTDVEADRLGTGIGALEFERTKELIAQLLPPAAKVADVGGAVGWYADWLAELGHDVDLVDPVPSHVESARARAGDPPRFRVLPGDARTLPLADDAYDAVLLLGPLYHLGEASERARALGEATRICRAGGVVVAAAISRYAPLLHAGIVQGRIADERVFANVQSETLTGRRVPAERRTGPFPDAYFHRPDELAEELGAAGLADVVVYGVEGPGWLLADFETSWADPTLRERILWIARTLETDPHVVALGPHLLAAGRNGTSS